MEGLITWATQGGTSSLDLMNTISVNIIATSIFFWKDRMGTLSHRTESDETIQNAASSQVCFVLVG